MIVLQRSKLTRSICCGSASRLLSLVQASGSPRESVSGSGTTLSSWDSAWEQGGLAASLPSCTAQSASGGKDDRRTSITGPESPLSPAGPCLTADRLWVPPSHAPGTRYQEPFPVFPLVDFLFIILTSSVCIVFVLSFLSLLSLPLHAIIL
jgi:hypothetical protein